MLSGKRILQIYLQVVMTSIIKLRRKSLGGEMREFNYEYITEEEQMNILQNEVKKLEAQHWALVLIEPNKLQDSQAHLGWQQQITSLESAIDNLKRRKAEYLNKNQ